MRHVRHETRDTVPSGWVKRSKLEAKRSLPMRIALKQENLGNIEEYLMDVSHPDSANYGKHWSHKTIAETFAPSIETVEKVHSWLTSAGISPERIKQSQSLSWLHFDATVEEAEDLLKTEYFLYVHQGTGQGQVACTEYHVPEHVSKHVDFVTPTVHFDTKLREPSPKELEKRKLPSKLGKPGAGITPKLVPFDSRRLKNELQDCSNNVTPDCLRALYGIPKAHHHHSEKNGYGIG